MSATTVALARRAAVGRDGVVSLAAGGTALLGQAPLWIWWALWRGGEPLVVWAPALGYLAVLGALLALTPRPALRGSRAVAAAALTAFAAWNTLSLTWAVDEGAAVNAAGRLWVVVLAALLVLLWPPSLRALAPAAGFFVAAAAAAAVVGITSAIGDPSSMVDGRVIGATGYVNATAALLVMGAATAVALAARRPLPWAASALAVAAAGTLAGAALLQQSRGAPLAAAGGAVVLLALSGQRVRMVVAFGLAAASAVALGPAMLDVRRAAFADEQVPALQSSLAALAVAGAVLLVVGALFSAARLPQPLRRAGLRKLSRGAGVVVVLGAVAAGGAWVVHEGGPAAVVDQRIDDLRTPSYGSLEESGNRFGAGLGSNRVDYWRVAWHLSLERPLGGTGTGNFQAAYLQRRDSRQAPLYTHDVWLATSSGTGVPGLLLLLAAVGAVAWGGVAAVRRSGPAARAVRVAAMAPAVVLTVHASADWSTAFPALTVPAVALAAGAVAPDGAGSPRGRRLLGWGPAVLALALAAAAAPSYLAARLSDRADATWTQRPDGALDDLRRAADIDRLSGRASLLEGVIALELHRQPLALRAFTEAARRNERAWYPRYLAGLLQTGTRPAAALALVRDAQRLNPGDEEVAQAARRLALGRPVDPLRAQRLELGPED
jgi:hypothetical protein